MSDRFRIDSHKLIYHPIRVAEFLQAGDDWEAVKQLYPIFVEFSPIGACNHRCTFCALDYMGYQAVQLDTELMEARLAEMGRLGVRSLHLAGEGEPFLHKGLTRMVYAAYQAGIDVGITTNFTVLPESFLEQGLDKVQWIKASINAGTSGTYDRIHRGKSGDFDKVFSNLRKAVECKRQQGLAVTLGAQSVLLPENAGEMESLAQRCREAGLDYLVIKPYSQHSYSETKQYQAIDYQKHLPLEERLAAYNTDDFQVVFRANTMKKHGESSHQRYQTCYSTPVFWAYVASNADVYSCSAYLSEPHFQLGNLHQQGFQALWEGDRRRENWQFVRNGLDISNCRQNCRMDEVNRYLFDLVKGRVRHVNFI